MGRALARAGADLVITSRSPESLGPFREENEEWVEYLCDRIPLHRPGQPLGIRTARRHV